MSPILSRHFRLSLLRPSLRFSLRSLMLAVTLCCFAAWSVPKYWEYRDFQLAAAWVQPLASQPISPNGPAIIIPRRPADLTSQGELQILRIAMTKLPRRQRLCGLKILMDTRGPEARGILIAWLPKLEKPEIRAAVLQMAALPRDGASLRLVAPYLEDPSPEVRAAAATAVGYIHNPRSWIPAYYYPVFLCSDPPINISTWRPKGSERSPAPPMREFRRRLERMLASVESGEERAAARGALAFWPPEGLELRLAELGVLETKQLCYCQALNSGRSYIVLEGAGLPEPCRLSGKRPLLIGQVTTQFQTDRPVVLRVGLWHSQKYCVPEAPPSDVPLRETREFKTGSQQLLVSAEPHPWLSVASTSGTAAVHNERLRAAAASWISDEEVAERYLHFNTPSSVQEPAVATLTRQTCILTTRDLHVPSGMRCCSGPPQMPTPYDDPPPPPMLHTPRIVLLLECEGNNVNAWESPLPLLSAQSVQISLADPPTHLNSHVQSRLQEILRERGLHDGEIDVLLAPWHDRFFKPGLRTLTILSRADFEQACPMNCVPYPSEVARVGIVVTEL